MAAKQISNHYVLPKTRLNYSRSIHKFERTHTTNLLTGYIVPVGFINCMPGDTVPNKFGFVLQSAPLLGPTLDNVYIDIISVWCPTRLVFANHNEWLGDNDRLAWTIPNGNSSFLPRLTFMYLGKSGLNNISKSYYAEHYRAPHYGLRYFDPGTDGVANPIYFEAPAGSGIPTIVGDQSVFGKGIQTIPFRMYDEIYNKLFRNQNIQSPILYGKGPGKDNAADASLYHYGGGPLYRANRLKNILTTCRLSPSIETVDLGLGQMLPVGFIAPSSSTATSDKYVFGIGNGTSFNQGDFIQSFVSSGAGISAKSDVYADLSAITVNSMYYAIMLQKYFNKASNGRRPVEFYKEFFGIDSSEVGHDDPQLLSQKRYKVNISRCVSTGNSIDPQGNFQTLGSQGAFSVTSVGGTLFPSFTATEYGMLHVFAVIRTQESIASGIDKYLADYDLLSTYLPVFDHIGEEALEYLEFSDITTNNATRVFGYNQAWYRYRYQMNDVVGITSPSEPLGYMTMAREFLFGGSAALNSDFIEQSPLEFDRILSFPVFYSPSGVSYDAEGEPYESNRYQWIIQFALAGDFARTISKDSEQLVF